MENLEETIELNGFTMLKFLCHVLKDHFKENKFQFLTKIVVFQPKKGILKFKILIR